MDFIESAILGGWTYDLVKSGLTYSLKFIANSLNKKISEKGFTVEPDILEEIATQLQSLPEAKRETKESLIQAIDTNQTIQSLLEQIKPTNQATTIIQNVSGSHAKTAGRDFTDNSTNTTHITQEAEKKNSPNT